MKVPWCGAAADCGVVIFSEETTMGTSGCLKEVVAFQTGTMYFLKLPNGAH